MGGGSVDTMKVAKTAAATTIEDASVKTASDNTKRRLAAANSRDRANSFWSALSTGTTTNGGKKTTLG